MAESHWHPEIEYVEDPRWPEASRYRGRDSVLRCFLAYTEALGREEDFMVTVERVVDAEDRQVVFVRFRASASPSGVPHEHLWGYVTTVRDGRLALLRAYYDPSEALEAVGLRE